MPDPLEPYLIEVQVLDDDNSTPRTNIQLMAVNESTGESITTYTDSRGEAVFDCANFFVSGYSDLDFIKILTNATGTNGKELRIRIISHGIGQIDEIKVKYNTRS